MGNRQVVPKPYVFATSEEVQKWVDVLRTKHYKGDRTVYSTPCQLCFCIYNVQKDPSGWATYRKLDWERIVKAAFPERAYVISYQHFNGVTIDINISFVQFPDPFAQQLNPRGEPVGPSLYCSALDIPPTENEKKEKEKEKEKETPVGRTAQEIREAYALNHSQKTD
jgi:hypothetical protein